MNEIKNNTIATKLDDNFKHISRIFRFQISNIGSPPSYKGSIYNPNVQRPIFHVDTILEKKGYMRPYAHDRNDVMASYLNQMMYMPRPVNLNRKGVYYLIMYKEDGPNAGQAFIIDDESKLGDGKVTMDDFLFWDVFVWSYCVLRASSWTCKACYNF